MIEVLKLDVFVTHYVWIWCSALLIFPEKITANIRNKNERILTNGEQHFEFNELKTTAIFT